MVAIEEDFQLQGVPAVRDHAIKWHFVTNQRNLFFMLASGMVMPPAGFRGKYYEDTLSCFPGWIPVFPDFVPKAAIEYSVNERNHLIPCILEVNLQGVRGPVKAVRPDGSVENIDFPEGVTGNEVFILLPAPLPVSLISSVIFENKDQKVTCEKDASDFDNVSLSDLSLRAVKGAFNKATTVHWPQKIVGITERLVTLDKPLAAGGVLAMLVHLGNTGDLAIETARRAFDLRGAGEDMSRYRILAALGDWFQSAPLSADHGMSASLYWHIVDSLIDAQVQSDLAPLDVVLGALAARSIDMDALHREGIENLVKELKGLVGLGEHTVTEIFERHAKPFPRALILFFLLDNCEEFLQFRHSLLNEYDYVAAAILFAVREQWLGLPLSLRNIPGLKNACCRRMAAMSHQLAGSSLDFGEVPAKPESLRELLRGRPWKKAQSEAALLLARKCGWNCIHTRISLGKGEYRLAIDGQGMHFILEGEPKAVKTEADYDVVLGHLAAEPVPAKVEIAARTLLKG